MKTSAQHSTYLGVIAVGLFVASSYACNEKSRNANMKPQAASPPIKTESAEAPTADVPSQRVWNELTPEEERVIVHKGTEPPFSGKLVSQKADGTYTCRRCGASLFSSKTKFDSGTGWPSFDEAIEGAVEEIPDADGMRTEIVCANCGAHLGHVFKGEGFTDKSVRHCVNSVSLDFTPQGQQAPSKQNATEAKTAKAYFAGGCFWGVEYYFEKVPGVLDASSGYMGGKTASPSYEEVSSHGTGHAETVAVTYDPSKVTYEELAKLFFEVHDPTQVDRQGPDVGSQYRSAVFVSSEQERRVVEKLIAQLRRQGLKVATEIQNAGPFWKAEGYHQDYYQRTGKQPYCHTRVRRFDQ
jgi:peptide methionine sulfoxide reductase msrA/msrB